MLERRPALNEGHTIPRLVLRVASGPGQVARLVDLAAEVVLLADEVVLDVSDFPDDCLALAAFVGAVSSRSKVKVCGLRRAQVRQLFDLGIDPAVILVGRFATTS